MKVLSFGVIVLLFSTLPLYAADPALNSQTVAQTPSAPANETAGQKTILAKSSKTGDFHFDLGFRMAYMAGFNEFNLNHHRSELRYPMDVYLGGVGLSLGYKRFSVAEEYWGFLFNDPSRGWQMGDKDWDSAGNLESYTKHRSSMNSVTISDSSMRYNILEYSFSRRKEVAEKKKIKVKFGGLLGYRYQRFRQSMHGSYQTVGSGEDSNDGEDVKVFGYRVSYHIPYIGLATEVGNDRLGISFGGKCGIAPTANDVDDHLLRQLVTFGEYRKDPAAFILNAGAYYKVFRDWKINGGIDFTFININGRLHERNNDQNWNLDQNIRNRQFIFWWGLGYSF